MVFDGSMAETARLLGLAAARTVPLVLSIPLLGGPALPMQLRLALGLGLAVLCMPILGGGPVDASALAWAVLATREVVVGVVMGFVVACFFRAAEMAGDLTDVLRGGGLLAAPTPVGTGQTRPLGALLLLFATVLFLETGGLGHVASALARSYEAIPVRIPLDKNDAGNAAMVVILASGKLIEAGVGLAAPALVALLLTDVAFAVIGRALPRMPIPVVAVPVKALLGLAVVLLGLGGLDGAMQDGWRGFLRLLTATFHLGQ